MDGEPDAELSEVGMAGEVEMPMPFQNRVRLALVLIGMPQPSPRCGPAPVSPALP